MTASTIIQEVFVNPSILAKFAPVKKCLLFICFTALISTLAHAQQRDELRLISSSHSRLNATTGNMMNYRPVYEHHGSTLSADSGYVYNDDDGRQFFDAFGKVIITQPNGTVIYADKLHYIAETQLATLTNNVRMVDDNSVLTTNHLTYNMKSSVGTYTGGGRIVNTTDTITSKNAYYFDNTKDAYFRYDVVVRTPDVKIYTDTMRYNSGTKMTYFYGPTNIKGNDGENLYTERGEYNTDTEQAWFDRNNLYTEGSRFLRGDSLYYDGTSGNGRAVQNVVFIDTAQQYFTYGGEGVYDRSNESITMTRNPLVMTVTRNDSTATDSAASDSTVTPIDSIRTTPIDSSLRQLDTLQQPQRPAVDTIYMTADTLFSQLILLKDYIPKEFDLDREGGEIDDYEDEVYGEDFGTMDDMDLSTDLGKPTLSRDSLGADTNFIDSLQRQPVDTLTTSPDSLLDVLKAPPDSASLAKAVDSVAAVRLSTTGLDALTRNLEADSILRDQAVIPIGGEADSLLLGAVAAVSRPPTAETLPSDSLASDTVKTRIIKAYYNVRLFKSDLQAVADSVYYGYPDSMMRFFGRPMIWAQGSQMTADTIYMQIRNEQLDNMLLVSNSFMVNTQLDSSKYNQIKGRRITGFFTSNALDRMFVDGNAESIYYTVDEKRKIYTNMYHSRSSRIKILVDSNQITYFNPIRRVDGKVYPMHLIPQDVEILEGFVWKPGDRPTSKEDLLARRRPAAEVAIAPDSTDVLQPPGGRPVTPGNDSLPAVPDTIPRQRIGKDSLGNSSAVRLPLGNPRIKAVSARSQQQYRQVHGQEGRSQLMLAKQLPIMHRDDHQHRDDKRNGSQTSK
ncbi:OstA-like protein [Parapedobacter koreensis]|uniref:OstA-like protein n=2 Tax=Parapedobacter koreensis TaxID=332977 RepID=A0A1H7JAF8_9SPHI|nr:OstA-like protein [Parapedobacter koreensis]